MLTKELLTSELNIVKAVLITMTNARTNLEDIITHDWEAVNRLEVEAYRHDDNDVLFNDLLASAYDKYENDLTIRDNLDNGIEEAEEQIDLLIKLRSFYK